MMTLPQTERLVRKIAEVAAHPPSDTQTAKLAHDYAEVCRSANRRLEQCALMIEAGQFLQALQLAETAPPLMDLITLLSFRQAAEWRTYCQAHQLPWTEPFYDKYIRQLNEAYGKGIAGDHPFYRDYRRAVMEADDARAFSILRVISRLNPSDPNTKEELKRLEEKLLRVKLESLRQVLAAGDPVNIQAGLEQLEASGLPVPASHPVWQQAQVARCQVMLRRGEELRRQQLWQDAEVVVEEIHAFATRYNVRLPEADADLWTALEEWTTQERTAYAARQDFQRAVSALEYEAGSLASQRAAGARLKKADATSAFNSLAAKWREAEGFGQALGEDLAGQCQEVSGWLQKQIQDANRRKRLLVIVAALVVLGALGAAIPVVLNTARQKAFARQIERLESARKVSEVESLVNKAPAAWKFNPQMSDCLGQARDFVAREKESKQTFDRGLAELQRMAAAGFGAAPARVGPARASCQQALNRLAPEYRAAAASALAAWDAQWQTFRNAELDRVLTRAEQAASVLNATNGVEPLRTAIPPIQAMLTGLASLEAQPPPLEARLADRLGGLTNKIENWTATAAKWEQAQAGLSNAPSLENYLEALDQLVLSPFATGAQKAAVERIHLAPINQETLLGQLLRPDDPSNWNALTNVGDWSDTLMPEQPTEQERNLYFKLRDDENVKEVYAYDLIPNTNYPRNSSFLHLVFVRGAITNDPAGDKAGIVYDQARYRDELHFVPTAYSSADYIEIRNKGRLQECDSYERLGLGKLIDGNTGNYQKPILQIFDQLNQDTNASPLFRAFVTFKLLAVAQLRSNEWGFQWCPALADHLQALKSLDADQIESGDWMVYGRSRKFLAPLQAYFEKAGAIPLEKQARFLQQLARQTCAKGFEFDGYIDAAGSPVVRTPAAELCGWNRAGTAAVLLRKTPGAETYTRLADALPYSPLFAFAGDRRGLLSQILDATGYPRALAGPILPPFFKTPYE